jgi:hypothetical protein
MSRRDSDVPDRPYKGLMPYSEEDAPFFFGREEDREIITANLLASRLTLLYGASGVGKTSVLRAGVAHQLRQLAQQNLAERGTPEFAVVVFSSWRDDPLAGLADRVQDSVAQALSGRAFEPVPPSRSLTQTLQAWTEQVGGDLLIILDQFEQYFLYHPQEDGEGTFALEFPHAVNSSDLRVSFLVSIRADSLAKLDHFKERIPSLFNNYLRIEHLDREAGRAAIEKPIERYTETVGQQFSVELALVEAVLDQVRTGQVVLGEAGRGVVRADISTTPDARIEAPYLQLVMTRLWDEEMRADSQVLRRETLDRLGGAKRIVRTHLDEVMNMLAPGEQKAAARAFHYLVTPSGTKIAHTVPDLTEYAKLPQKQLSPVLDRLSQPAIRILRPVVPPPDQPTAQRYEIFHDVLAPAVLDWRSRYIAIRRLGLLVTVLTVVFLLAVGLTVFMIGQQAQKARLATSRRLAAQARTRLDNQLDLALLLSLEANRTADTVETRGSLLAGLEFSPHLTTFLHGHTKEVWSVAFSPDGQTLASGSADNTIILWDVEARQPLGSSLTGHKAPVLSVAFSPDGQKLASSSADNAIILWDVATDQPLGQPLSGHTDWVYSVAFSPDGQTLASGSRDNAIILWDVATGQPLGQPLTGQSSCV